MGEDVDVKRVKNVSKKGKKSIKKKDSFVRKNFGHKCGKSQFQSKSHQLVQAGEKPFQCEDCSRKFSWVCHLRSHQLVHTGEKPFQCEQCSCKFSQAGNLKRHQLVHTGEKPFQCSICSKKFSQFGNLKSHQLVHTREKPL